MLQPPNLVLPEPLLKGRRREFNIECLTVNSMPAAVNVRTLMNHILPPWQQPEVWSYEQKVRFIEGIFLGLGTGYYVATELEW